MSELEDTIDYVKEWLSKKKFIDDEGNLSMNQWEGDRWTHIPPKIKFYRETNQTKKICIKCYSVNIKKKGYIWTRHKCLECNEYVKVKKMTEMDLENFYIWAFEWSTEQYNDKELKKKIESMTKQDFAKLLVKHYCQNYKRCCCF